MKIQLSVLASFVLAACVGSPPVSEIAYYDIPGSVSALPAPLRSLDVTAASWLSGSAMHYRLGYADPGRRERYVQSRWTAPPAELMEVRLQRSLLVQAEPSAKAKDLCRLHLDLDDWVQTFDTPGHSQLHLDVRATLYGGQQSVLARRSLSLEAPAGSDAQGAVAASPGLIDVLAHELQTWSLANCTGG